MTELRAMEQRYEVAAMLSEGKVYTDIMEKSNASSATISRVNRCIKYGNEGYIKVLDRLNRKARRG